ncbi:MAG TPA: FAD-binding oxidoreductase [Acidimicrobiales bacterium]|nr:FAD-binding oxidoreductase [Acidimicrobiales bacterium]
MSGSQRFDVVIVGAGVSGLSTARALVELGLDDVLVLDRATVGSGGSGKSSGIVRCHYGIRSLAAMAWHALPVLANAEEILGAESGYRRTGYLVGVGQQNIGALRANVAMHQSIGIDVDLVGHDAAASLWPTADLNDFAEFAYEPLGGYGDGHQTAQAFSVAARRGGAQLRQNSTVISLDVVGERAVGVQLASGEHISAGQVVLAAGPWSVPLAAAAGIDVPIRAQRAQILLVDPGQPVGPVPVFSDLVSLQYVRMEGKTSILLGDSDHSEPEWSDPDQYRERAIEDELIRMIPKFEHRFPGLSGVGLSSSYAGCYDVTPDYNPIISASPIEGLWLCAGFSGHGYKISPSTGELMADIMTTGQSRHVDVDHRDFRFDRFASQEYLVSPHPYAGAGQMR